MTTAPVSASVDHALAHADKLLAARPDLALQQADVILQSVPAHPQAELIKGAAHRRLGALAQAALVLQPLARTQPSAALVHQEWGLTQAAMGNQEGAMASLHGAVRLNPDLAQAWQALADLHHLAGDRAAAEVAHAQHLRAGVHDPTLRHAATALCDNDLPRAEHLLRAHLRQHPTDVAALRMLAEAGTRLGRDHDAETLLQRALHLMPGFSAARHNYAVVLFRQNKGEEALRETEILLAEGPSPTYRNLQAACLAMLGDYDKSIAAYRQVLEEAPRQPKIWLSFGHALKTAGHRAESVHAYRTCLDLAPGLGEAWWSLANLKNEPFSQDDIAAMRSQIANDAIIAEDRFHLQYALGAALEQARDYAGSFEHYVEGARLRRAEISYSADRTHAQTQRTRALLTREFFAERAGWGCPDPAPIFVVGLPRSGSTLIEQILASHSAIEGTAELPEIVNIARDLDPAADDRYPTALASLTASSCASMGKRYIARTRIQRKLNRSHFIDKLPNNFVHIGLIHLILPNAKIIDARRHPAAACFSAFKQHFARGQHFSYNLTELGRYYADYLALMAHFDTDLPGCIKRVNYERIVSDTEAETRALLTFLGLPFEPACLRFHETARAVRTASSEQVRQPIYREGLSHWRNFEPWLGELFNTFRREGVGFSNAPDIFEPGREECGS